MRVCVFGLLLSLVTAVAFAAKSDVPTGLYVGGGVGIASVRIKGDRSIYDFDGSAASTRAFAGYRFLPWVAVEGAYDDFGKAEDTVNSSRLRSSFNAWSIGPVGLYPMGPIDFRVTLGLSGWRGSVRNLGTGFRDSFDNTDLMGGVGVQYRIDRFLLRVDHDMFVLGFDDDHNHRKDYNDWISNWTVGVAYTF